MARISGVDLPREKRIEIGLTYIYGICLLYTSTDRLVNLALPRVRDFRGVNPDAFDGRGNYALGIKEQLIFPEIEDVYKRQVLHSMQK